MAVVLAGLLAVGDEVMSLLVLGVIRMHNGQLSRTESLGVLAQATVLSLMTAALAVVVVLLLSTGALGFVLIVVLIAMLAFGYRGYVAMSRRHSSLALVHEFVTGGVGAESVESLCEQLLSRIRTLLWAARVELVLFDVAWPADRTLPGRRRLPRAT